jgi:hypothetical protein
LYRSNNEGKPCSHLIFGVDQAINTGNGIPLVLFFFFYFEFMSTDNILKLIFPAMYFFPLIVFRDYREKKLLDEKTLIKCYELFGQELLNLHLGQGLDIHWHKGGVNPGVEEYLQMCVSSITLWCVLKI